MEATRDNTLVSSLLVALAEDEPRFAGARPAVLSRGHDGLVVGLADTVFKVHEASTDEAELTRRLAVVCARKDVFLQPLSPAVARCADRLVTRWPHAEALRPDDASLPWSEAATLLGRLHAECADVVDPGRFVPVGGGPRRVLRAVERLRARAPCAERDLVLRAFATLRDDDLTHRRSDRVVHGDFHLGQLVRGPDGLRFIDVDEVGRGDPAWDLARPAAWYASGLMPEVVWNTFLDAYRLAAGESAAAFGLAGEHDPWLALEAPARALVVQSAASALVRREAGAPGDGFDVALLEACEKIAQTTRGEGTKSRLKLEGS